MISKDEANQTSKEKNRNASVNVHRRSFSKLSGREVILFLARNDLVHFLGKKALSVLYRSESLREIHGHAMYIPPDGMFAYWLNDFEPEVTEVFLSRVMPGDVVLDIGAHIGYYTLLAARLVGNEGRVIAFEPDPRNYSLLVKNVAINGYRNVTAVQKAVSLNSGRGHLYEKQGSSDSSIVRLGGHVRKRIVETVALDDFCKSMFVQPENIRLIKMDIEGAEMMALLGMQGIIKQSKELTIISEIIPAFMSKSGFSPEDYISKLRENQFSVGVIRKKKIGHSLQAEIVPIETIVDTVYAAGAYLVCSKTSGSPD